MFQGQWVSGRPLIRCKSQSSLLVQDSGAAHLLDGEESPIRERQRRVGRGRTQVHPGGPQPHRLGHRRRQGSPTVQCHLHSRTDPGHQNGFEKADASGGFCCILCRCACRGTQLCQKGVRVEAPGKSCWFSCMLTCLSEERWLLCNHTHRTCGYCVLHRCPVSLTVVSGSYGSLL